MRSTNRRRARANPFALPLFSLLISSAAIGASARAAELFVDAPDSCVDPAALADEVSDLIGKSLASVAEVDFRLQITETRQRRWRLRLETLGQRDPGQGEAVVRGSREIEGTTCAELAEAASVAIAVSVRSIAGEAGPTEPSIPAPAPAKPPSEPSPRFEAPLSLAHPASETPSWRPTVALALATDTGALPNTGLGVDLEVALQRGSLRLAAFGTWFGSENTVVANAGGTFQLALGGALGCFAPRWGRWTPLACGGLELGRLAGTGAGSDVARPRTGSAFWRAARADAGVMAKLGDNLAALLRAGVAVPLVAPPAFVLDETDVVYRPSHLTLRLTAGLVLEF